MSSHLLQNVCRWGTDIKKFDKFIQAGISAFSEKVTCGLKNSLDSHDIVVGFLMFRLSSKGR